MATKDKIVYVLTWQTREGSEVSLTVQKGEEVFDWLESLTKKSKHISITKENSTRGLILDLWTVK